jgi:Phosphodiester glycosidase
VGLGFLGVAVPGLWTAIHHVPGFGPALADGVRAVLGPRPVAWAEDVAYEIQDRVDRWRYRDTAPKTFWEAPAETTVAPLPAALTQVEPASLTSAAPAAPEPAPKPASAETTPAPFEPPFANVAATGDGKWLPMKGGTAADEPPALWKSVVHPDGKRGFAAVAVVAIDLARIDLRLVAGTSEPYNEKIPTDHRPGLIPKDAAGDLVAAFNGGFKAVHGHWGMMLNGETFVPPRDVACTVALYRDGSLKIRTWPEVKASAEQMVGYRQTPPCLVEEGKTNTALDVEYAKGWGATVSGETVIRRSAIGLDKTGKLLFFAIGEAVTAQSLSRAMKAIGAENAAQLDVNYAYPRFLMYERGSASEAPHAASALIPGIKFSNHEYVGEASPRDFFYLVRHRASS